MRMRTLLTLSLVVLCLPGIAPAQSKDWSLEYAKATDGHDYALTRTPLNPDQLVRPDWKSVTWNFGPVAGRDVTEQLNVLGGGFWLRAKGSSGVYAGVNADFVGKEQGKTRCVFSASFGWQTRVRS